ncbi:MAG: hypothetical protein DMG60_22525, partial [Acidobacteria bacterium]
MPQANEVQTTVPNIQDKRKPAPGVLPKNAQSWIVIGLTSVILLLLWVSGPAHGAKSAKKPDAGRTEPVNGLTSADIAARLDQERREQQAASLPPARSLSQQYGGVESSAISAQQTAAPVEQDPIKQDMRRRQYTSLFSSSVSLSYRPQASETAKSLTEASPQVPLDLSALQVPNVAAA